MRRLNWKVGNIKFHPVLRHHAQAALKTTTTTSNEALQNGVQCVTVVAEQGRIETLLILMFSIIELIDGNTVMDLNIIQFLCTVITIGFFLIGM